MTPGPTHLQNNVPCNKNHFFRTVTSGDVFDAHDWYVGLGLNLKQDEFSDLNLRTRLGPHIGYQFYESKLRNVFIQDGFEAVQEDYADGEIEKYWASTCRLSSGT